MTAHLPPSAAHPIDSVAAYTPGALIAGPCELPQAPLAMPAQVTEAPTGLLRRLPSGLIPHHPTAPSTGAGV